MADRMARFRIACSTAGAICPNCHTFFTGDHECDPFASLPQNPFGTIPESLVRKLSMDTLRENTAKRCREIIQSYIPINNICDSGCDGTCASNCECQCHKWASRMTQAAADIAEEFDLEIGA